MLSTILTRLENLLASTTVKTEQIHSVEVVGGSTRIPLVKSTVQQVFGKAPSTTLNADEEVSRGCALTAAGVSAKFITKQFVVEEAVHHGIEKCVEKMICFTDQLRRLKVDQFEYVSMKLICLLTSGEVIKLNKFACAKIFAWLN